MQPQSRLYRQKELPRRGLTPLPPQLEILLRCYFANDFTYCNPDNNDDDNDDDDNDDDDDDDDQKQSSTPWLLAFLQKAATAELVTKDCIIHERAQARDLSSS